MPHGQILRQALLRLVHALRPSRYPHVLALLVLILKRCDSSLVRKLNDRSVKTWTKNVHPFCSVRLKQVSNNRNHHKNQL